jgi:hypothetical protein
MTDTLPCSKRTFPLQLGMEFLAYHSIYLAWLKYLLERLGYKAALRIWVEAIKAEKDPLAEQILSSGWQEISLDVNVDREMERMTMRWFNRPVQGVTKREAWEVLEHTPTFAVIRSKFKTFNYMRPTTTYEALHLFCHGLAKIAEGLIRTYGKQGELLVYDTLQNELMENPPVRMSVPDYMRYRRTMLQNPPEVDSYTAGMDIEFLKSNEGEMNYRVNACEWARYYQERHPSVGYLMACSLDHSICRAYNKNLFLQRTSTLMEGGKFCDFRIFAFEADVSI